MTNYAQFWTGRGLPSEYDPGPPKSLQWATLFSQTPNYRGLANAYMNDEKFRWHFGPMYYRGRLQANQVKVLIIGQEGAMDESLAHRSFVGFSGGTMQHVLSYLGIDFSYLFLNTFVYPINGQYSETKIKHLGQNPHSPITIQRNNIFNYARSLNDIHLILAVGNAAKESVKTWIESLGGSCPDGIADLTTAGAHVIGPNTKAIGVIHPGATQDAGSVGNIVLNYQNAMAKIKSWIDADANWLPVDVGMTRAFGAPFQLDTKPIPFRDLPFGISWRIGNGNSTSTRLDNQRSIQIRSSNIPSGSNANYSGFNNGSKTGYAQPSQDVPYEPPVADHFDYDEGAPDLFLKTCMGLKPGLPWPQFDTLGATVHPSFGYLPIYRGNPKNATSLLLCDQQSSDDMFTMRAMTGHSGQKLQGFLNVIGLSKSYCILRNLPVDVMGLSFSLRKSIALDTGVVQIYKDLVSQILAENKTKFILLVGSIASLQWDVMQVQTTIPVFRMKSWSQSGSLANWQSSLGMINGVNYSKDHQASFQYTGARLQIPRADLPYGVLRWQGSSGDRVQRARLDDHSLSPYHFKNFVPKWVYDLKPYPLDANETAALNLLP